MPTVVYRSFPTSNHNPTRFFLISSLCCISFFSYIKPQLCFLLFRIACGCISFFSYIKPQQSVLRTKSTLCCISFFSYIKPQRMHVCPCLSAVVYRSFPTSNHNTGCYIYLSELVVYRSFPTSNHNLCHITRFLLLLYIVLFLHQTTTKNVPKYTTI